MFIQFTVSVMRMMSVMSLEWSRGQRPPVSRSLIRVSVYTGAGELTSDNDGVTWSRCPQASLTHFSHLSRPAPADDKIDF